MVVGGFVCLMLLSKVKNATSIVFTLFCFLQFFYSSVSMLVFLLDQNKPTSCLFDQHKQPNCVFTVTQTTPTQLTQQFVYKNNSVFSVYVQCLELLMKELFIISQVN